jgi:hypothetical protein
VPAERQERDEKQKDAEYLMGKRIKGFQHSSQPAAVPLSHPRIADTSCHQLYPPDPLPVFD